MTIICSFFFLGGTHNNQANETSVNEPKLQDEILSILGDDNPKDKPFSDPLQGDVASRWTHILATGLDEETRNKIINKYVTPENCPLMNPPNVNPEVKVAVPESVLKRDARLAQLQQQVGASLSAVGLALTNMLKENESNKEYIQILSDAGRLLANIHHSESMSRRDLIAINLNKEIKDTLTNTPVNNLLFGTDLENRIKTVKDLEKSGQQLKIQKKTSKVFQKPYSRPSTSRYQENYRSPLPQNFRARRSGHFNRATPDPSQRRQHQILKKKTDSFRNEKRRRPPH